MENNNLEYALGYARKGLHVFPCHSIRNGKCSCGIEKCSNQGKHPRTLNGFKDATIDENKIVRYWGENPDANIGCATGEISGIVVLDIDIKHNRSSKEFKIPPTAVVKTGGGGEHLFFKYPGKNIKSTNGQVFGIGVDIKADGGYVILAPSLHLSGNRYEWIIPFEDKEDLAEMPDWFLNAININQKGKKWFEGRNGVSEGSRNETATSMAGKLLISTPYELWENIGWENLKVWNQKCFPPLDERELRNTWDGIKKKHIEGKNNVLTTESLLEILKKIPSDTPKIQLIKVLDPILRELISFEKITAETFILDNIKNYFKITKEDAKKYISYLNKLRIGLLKERKIAKEKEESLPLVNDRDIDFQEAYNAVLDIGIVNIETFKIVTALVISAQLRSNPPLWLFLIGVPSSFKTELVGLFSAMEEVYTLDTLTENAFASGYVPADGSETQDLLPLLDNKCFIIKDLNTLFSMNEEMVKKILGDLTSIFDGKFQKFTATRGMIEYSALFSMIGCITPSILIKHYNYATQLGPRFFFLRLPELTDEEIQSGFNKSWNEVNRKEKIIKTRQIVSSYCTQLLKRIKEVNDISVSIEIREQINKISIFICKTRGIAITAKSSFKDEKGNDVEFYEIKDWQVEQPWRILNQLKSLLKILSFINNKKLVNEDEIKLIKPIILSTMPVDRAEILSLLTKECGLSRKQLSQKIGKSIKTIGRTMKELEALRIVDCFRDPNMNIGGKAPWLFFIVEDFASILDAPLPSQESLSLSKNNTQVIDSDIEEDSTF